MESRTRVRRLAAVMAFLRRHRVLCLLLLTPGIPEYLSGSSPVSALLLNPLQFGFQLVANLGLYGPGALLIREAMVRWNKGWGSVLLLGAAYGIIEEGVALSTLFNPKAGPVGQLGIYGHWLGVSWIWVAAILPVHMIYSISIPILLLGLVAPWTRHVRFLTGKVPLVLALLVADVVLLFLLVVKGVGFWMGAPVLGGSLVAIGVLVGAARLLPAAALRYRSGNGGWSPLRMAILGAVFYPSVLILDSFADYSGIPAALTFVLSIALQGLFLVLVVRNARGEGRERRFIALVLGLAIPIMTIGLISQIGLPIVLVADAAMVLFLRELWSSYPGESGITAQPP